MVESPFPRIPPRPPGAPRETIRFAICGAPPSAPRSRRARRGPSRSSFAPGIPPKRCRLPTVSSRSSSSASTSRLPSAGLQRSQRLRPTWSPGLTAGELMLAMAREDFGQGVQIADRLASLGERGELARASSQAAALMAWFYLSAGRVQEAQAVLAGRAANSEVMRSTALTQEHVPEADVMVPLTGGPLDALVMRVHASAGCRSSSRNPPPRGPQGLPAVADPGPGGARTDRAGAHGRESATAGDGGSLVLRALFGPSCWRRRGVRRAWNELRRGRADPSGRLRSCSNGSAIPGGHAPAAPPPRS